MFERSMCLRLHSNFYFSTIFYLVETKEHASEYLMGAASEGTRMLETAGLVLVVKGKQYDSYLVYWHIMFVGPFLFLSASLI